MQLLRIARERRQPDHTPVTTAVPAPWAGLEPATKRLNSQLLLKRSMPHGDTGADRAFNERFGRKQRAATSSAMAPSGSPLTLPPSRFSRILGRCRARYAGGMSWSSTPFSEGVVGAGTAFDLSASDENGNPTWRT